jgi:hypothetical protein
MKTKKIFSISMLFLSIHVFSQQIGDGFAPTNITDFTLPLKSGLYGSSNPIGSTPDASHPWQHLLVVRHGNPANNHQLQIGSAFSTNDRLFFRKLAGGLESMNPTWIELATRGSNTFTGNQIINGNVVIGTINPTSIFSVGIDHGVKLSVGNLVWAKTAIIETGYNNQVGDFTDVKVAGNATNDAYIRIVKGGNVGIGTTNPTSKLTVKGDIHSREVKVTVEAGADFVFAEDYDLPSLDSVHQYIKENKHLPEIASASEMKKDGINLSEMNIKLLQKVEELTLYTIEQEKKNNIQSKEIETLKKENQAFKSLSERLFKLENQSK